MSDPENECREPGTDTGAPAAEGHDGDRESDPEANQCLIDDVGSRAVARGEEQTLVVHRAAGTGANNVICGLGAWLDNAPHAGELDAREEVAALPDAAARLAAAATLRRRPARGEARRDYDARQFDLWAARVLDLGLTDIVIPMNHGHEPPHSVSGYLAADGWRRLRFLTRVLTEHRYPDGSPASPRVHLLAFCGVDSGFIAACAAAIIEACQSVPAITSVMLDCEEWWVGNRRHRISRETRGQAASEVRARLFDAWPRARRPPGGIGVTGLASAPPPELLAFLDYGLPQIYGSERNMGGLSLAAARSAHQRFNRVWLQACGGERAAGECRIIVGHTANGAFVDPARIRLLVEAALEIGGSGEPPLTAPEAIYYWSTRHILGNSARKQEIMRLAHLARHGGIRLANLR